MRAATVREIQGMSSTGWRDQPGTTRFEEVASGRTPLDGVYPVVFFDALRVKRHERGSPRFRRSELVDLGLMGPALVVVTRPPPCLGTSR